MSDLDSILLEVSSFVKSEFNLELEKSQLKPYSPENWQEFCQINGFDFKSEGLYVPNSYSAYVRTDSPILISNVFHELFGHGLFVEHSKIGRKLVSIIHKKGDENFFLFNKINTKEQILGITEYNIENYEGFALWVEALICEETDNSKVWQLKKDRLPNNFVSLFEFFQDTEQRISRFGFMSQLGFPKFYDDKKIFDATKKIYGSTFDNIDFVVLYGSQKPESDIDLFIVSNNPSINYFNGWLDIYEVNREEFKEGIKNLDISITDPLFSGKLIYGNKNYFEKIRKKVKNRLITQEAINYNLIEVQKQKILLKSFSVNNKRRKDCLSYIDSFSQNAEQLKVGNKHLTLSNLKKIYLK